MPDSENPEPPQIEEQVIKEPTEISIDEYHVHADRFMEDLMAKLEVRGEEKNDVDAEYTVSHS